MAKKKKKTKRRKPRTKGGYKLQTERVMGILKWPKHWGMIAPESREGALMLSFTARPSSVLLKIFSGSCALFTDNHDLPLVFSTEMSTQDAMQFAKELQTAAEDSKTFAYCRKTQ